MKYSRPIRVLHLLLAVGIPVQLVLSLVMEVPKPDQPVDALPVFLFTVHSNLGLALLVVLIAHWLLFFTGHAHQGMGHFFPWFSASRRTALVQELKQAMASFRLADPDAGTAIASAGEGLGLVIASLLVATGLVLYLGIAANGAMSPTVHTVKEFHQIVGLFMWGYLVIHAGAAMLHYYVFSHRSILSVFNIKK